MAPSLEGQLGALSRDGREGDLRPDHASARQHLALGLCSRGAVRTSAVRLSTVRLSTVRSQGTDDLAEGGQLGELHGVDLGQRRQALAHGADRKSTRLNSSHMC